MRIRRVDANGDMVFGGDQAAIWRDVPDAVGVLVEARLNLWQGQWYLDSTEGLAVEQEILGRRTENLRDPAIQARILDTQGVIEIEAYDSALDVQTRALAVSATIQTAYSRSYLAGQGANTTNIAVKVENGR